MKNKSSELSALKCPHCGFIKAQKVREGTTCECPHCKKTSQVVRYPDGMLRLGGTPTCGTTTN
jgi:ssDNA-binding Zn-finger/Zn-ribbon topoisomerase 1